MKSENTGKCHLCENEEFTSYKFGLLKCSSCGLILDPNIWNKNANEDMVEVWFNESYDPISSFWVKIFENWNNKHIWKRISKIVSSGGKKKLLEIGVGSGSLLKFMTKKNFDVKGCDLSGAICNRVEKEFGIQMYNCSARQLPFDNLLDVVIMKHVLEHVVDPVKFLQEVKLKMKADGILYIAVPNAASWESRFASWTSYQPYHFVYFTSSTLRHTLKQAEFNVLILKTYETFSGWFLCVLRSLLKIRGNSSVQSNSKKHMHKHFFFEHTYRMTMIIFGILSFPFRYLQSRLGYGEELIVIAYPENSNGT